MVELEELRAPHLVLADVAGDNRFAARETVDFRNQVLWLDLIRGHFRLQRMLCLPAFDLRPPGRAGCGIFRLHRGRELTHFVSQTLQNFLDVAHDGNIRGPILANLSRIDIHVDHLRTRSERSQAAGHAIVETHAQRDDQIGFRHRHIGGVTAVHARHADEIRMRAGHGSQTH